MKTEVTTAEVAGRKRRDFTTEQVKAVERGHLLEAEWVDFKGLFARFAIRRSLGYELAKAGVIHSVSLRHRNRTRGKRLFSVDSVRAYLARCTGEYEGSFVLTGKRRGRKAKNLNQTAVTPKEKEPSAKPAKVNGRQGYQAT